MCDRDEFVSIRSPELRWSLAKTEVPHYELTSHEQLAGKLSFEKGVPNSAVFACSEGKWEVVVTRKWLVSAIQVKAPHDGHTLAAFDYGSVEPFIIRISESKEFFVDRFGLLLNKCQVKDIQGEVLFLYRPTDMSIKNIINVEATVEITATGLAEELLPILIIIVWQAVLIWGSESA